MWKTNEKLIRPPLKTHYHLFSILISLEITENSLASNSHLIQTTPRVKTIRSAQLMENTTISQFPDFAPVVSGLACRFQEAFTDRSRHFGGEIPLK